MLNSESHILNNVQLCPTVGMLGGGKLNFLYLLHMRDTHTNFQLPASKTDLTYNRSEMGEILPPGTLLLGELGGG